VGGWQCGPTKRRFTNRRFLLNKIIDEV
jgi:hypothetical protein